MRYVTNHIEDICSVRNSIINNNNMTVTNNQIDETNNVSISNYMNVDTSNICGFENNDGVSCHANSVTQILFHCETLINKIHNNELGQNLLQCLQQYDKENGTPETLPIRLYLTNSVDTYSDNEQQDCVQFLESLMN